MSTETAAAFGPSALELVARPLLRLVQQLTGMETTFITGIDWDEQHQDVLFSLNTGQMQIAEGGRVNWVDSMCRSMFLSGRSQTCAVGDQVTATSGAIASGMQSFFAVPILTGDSPIGTVCGASRRPIVLGDDKMESLQLVAEALQHLLQAVHAKAQAESRAQIAELAAQDARSAAEQQSSQLQHMEHLAHTDALTGLPNRRAFSARWEDALARSGRRGHTIGLMLIDADNFKTVNDSMGHLMGDAVLRAIGSALQVVAHSADVVARLGGDEFALAVTHADGRRLLAVAAEIRKLFAAAAAQLGVSTTLSIGIATSEECARHQLLAEADKALYRSKAAGGDRAELFTYPATIEGTR